jgi:hypothetical protein
MRYGIVRHMARNTSAKNATAVLLLHEKIVFADGAIAELVIRKLPRATPDRRHGLKYRLYFGRHGKCLVRYDNESGKDDHRHVLAREESYRFVSISKLRQDFDADIQEYGGSDEEKD